jgi:hypothetical protein
MTNEFFFRPLGKVIINSELLGGGRRTPIYLERLNNNFQLLGKVRNPLSAARRG